MRITVSGTIRTPHAEIRRLVEEGFAGVAADDVEVHVKARGMVGRGRRVRPRGRGFSGRAYRGVPGIANVSAGVAYLVTMMVPAAADAPTAHPYPHRWEYARSRRTGPVEFASWQEELFHLAAHEARHIHQYRHGLSASEADAEAWACARLADRRARRGYSTRAASPG
jgi:hypothetical protein